MLNAANDSEFQSGGCIFMKSLSIIRQSSAESIGLKPLWLKKLLGSWQLYLFVLPTLIYLALFQYAPMYGIQLAFKYYNPADGIWNSPWIGFENFERLFGSYYFLRLIRNTVFLNLYNLVVGFPFPILLALIMNELRNEKFKKGVQTALYAPHFVSVVVVVGILQCFFNTSNGLVNLTLKALGMEEVPFLASADIFPSLYVFSGLWQNAGWNSIIYIAALAGVDPQLHEAAQIDGASRFKRIIHINIPSLLPTATILFILEAGKMMNVGFEKVFLMQNAMNKETAEVISTFVYTQGLVNMEYGFSTAVGLFNNVINIALLLIFNAISKKVNESSLF